MSDLDLDLTAPGAVRKISISAEDRTAMGALADLKVRANLRGKGLRSDELALQVIEFVAGERRERTSDPFTLVRSLVAAERTFTILVRAGYSLEGFLPGIRSALDDIASMCRREIVRRLLRDEIELDKAEELLKLLSSQIDSGQWPDWETDIDQVEAALAVAG